LKKPILSIYRLLDQVVHTVFCFEEVTFSGDDGVALNIPHYSLDYMALFTIFHLLGKMGIPIYKVLDHDMSAYQLSIACIVIYTDFRMRLDDMTNEQSSLLVAMITKELEHIIQDMNFELEMRIPSQKIKTHVFLGCWKIGCDNEEHMLDLQPEHHTLLQPLLDYVVFLRTSQSILTGVSE